MTPEEVTASLQYWIDTHGGPCPTPCCHNDIAADLTAHIPSSYDDPYGKRADEAAATWENNWIRQGEWAQ